MKHGFKKQAKKDALYNKKYIKKDVPGLFSHAKYYYDRKGQLQPLVRKYYFRFHFYVCYSSLFLPCESKHVVFENPSCTNNKQDERFFSVLIMHAFPSIISSFLIKNGCRNYHKNALCIGYKGRY